MLKKIFFFTISLALSPMSVASVSSSNKLAGLNHFNSIQPAQSKGSLGLKASLSFEEYQWSDLPSLNRQIYRSTKQGSGYIGFTNVSIHKGTPWPIDLGLNVSHALGSDISKMGGYIKWTAFEGFKLPSLAIQYSKNKMFGLNSTQISGDQFSAIIDYSLFSYITVFGTFQTQYDSIVAQPDVKPAFAFDQSRDYKSSLATRSSNLGMLIRFWPGIAELTILRQNIGEEERNIIQLSFGL